MSQHLLWQGVARCRKGSHFGINNKYIRLTWKIGNVDHQKCCNSIKRDRTTFQLVYLTAPEEFLASLMVKNLLMESVIIKYRRLRYWEVRRNLYTRSRVWNCHSIIENLLQVRKTSLYLSRKTTALVRYELKSSWNYLKYWKI